MANTIDFSTVPAIVTIKNDAPAAKAFDAGSLQILGKAGVEGGKPYALKNVTARVQMYRVNSFIDIASGDTVKIVAETSEEVAYFKGLASATLKVTVAAKA